MKAIAKSGLRARGLCRRQEGSALVITLVTGLLIGLVLDSYLMLVKSRNTMAMRGTVWNTALPVLEAGIEEALTHLQLDTNNPTANSWAAVPFGTNQTAYWKHRVLPDGSYYDVTNTGVGTSLPLIYSAGYVPSPLNTDQYISRLVRVTVTNPPSVFSRAIAANGMIWLSGSATIDGYDSSKGRYDAITNRNADGGIATNLGDQPSINVGSAHVYGTAVTGPTGTVMVNGGSVGDLNQTGGIENGWVDNTMNTDFQDNSPPSGGLLIHNPLPTVVGISNITYLTANRATTIYQMDNFTSVDKTQPMIVTGNCTLYVPGNLTVAGTGYIYIMPGASLNLYVGGRATISGGGVVNPSGLPKNFSYFGLPTNTGLLYSGTADFYGTINAPEAKVTISGGAALYGAVICGTFNLSGGPGVHYDKSLASGGFLKVIAWREL
jgi:hypothetical protein